MNCPHEGCFLEGVRRGLRHAKPARDADLRKRLRELHVLPQLPHRKPSEATARAAKDHLGLRLPRTSERPEGDREELFPRPVFRHAFDRLNAVEERKASVRYLRLLQLAADFGEDRVADLLGALLRAGELPLADVVEVRLRDPVVVTPLALTAFTPELGSYDALITEVAS